MTGRRRQDESGSALVLALVFLTVIGMVTAMLLTFLDTAFETTTVVRGQRSELYSVDGAAKTALERIRADLEEGVDPAEGGSCSDFTAPSIDGRTVSVVCEGQAGSGKRTEGNTTDNTPPHALLSLAPSGGGIVQESNAAIRVGGSVFSNSTISIAAGSTLDVDGPVAALATCDWTKITTSEPPVRCQNRPDHGDPALGVDPAYPVPMTSIPVTRTAPSCPAGWLVTLQPGTYVSASSLDALTHGGCSGHVVWFQPGTYYFDFTGSNTVWDVTDRNVVVVGGTPKGWNPAAPVQPVIPKGGACKTTGDGDRAGVTIVLGGTSGISVRDGSLELCAPPSDASQQFAIYGVPSSAGDVRSTLTSKPTTAISSVFTPAASARLVDGALATGVVPRRATGTVSLSGYSAVATPAGALLESVKVRIAHRETNARSLTLTGTVGGTQVGSVGLSTRSSLTTDTIDVTSWGLQPAQLPNVGLTLSVEGPNGSGTAAAALDGVEVDVTFVVHGLDPLSGTALTTDGSPTVLAIHGTVYVPTATVSLHLPNAAMSMIDRGLIARVITLGRMPNSDFEGPVVSLPEANEGGRADRVVRFTARLCPTDAPCVAPGSGTARLRVLVTYDDQRGARPGAGVRLDQWSVLR